jgi:hypothetical protein
MLKFYALRPLKVKEGMPSCLSGGGVFLVGC